MEGRQAAELDPAAKKCTYNYGKCSYGPRCNFEHVSAVPTGPPPVRSLPATGDNQAGIGSAAVSRSGRTFLLFPTQ